VALESLALEPPGRANPRPAPRPASTTAAPPHAASRRRRLRCASFFLACSTARRLLSREVRPDTGTPNLRTNYVLLTYGDSSNRDWILGRSGPEVADAGNGQGGGAAGHGPGGGEPHGGGDADRAGQRSGQGV